MRIRKDASVRSNLSLNNYSSEFTLSESSAWGTLLYIADHLLYKPCQDWSIYEMPNLESTLIEVINTQKSNKHPLMDLGNFNKNFLNKLLEKVSKDNFNVNVLNYNDHTPYLALNILAIFFKCWCNFMYPNSYHILLNLW